MRRLWSSFPVFAALAMLLAFAPGARAGEARTFQLAINSQPLAAALQQLARQSGIQIIFFSKLTTGHVAPAVQGDVTIDYALHRLLDGSHLTYRRLNSGAIQIRPSQLSSDSPDPPADLPQGFAAPSGSSNANESASVGPQADPALPSAQVAAASPTLPALPSANSALHTVIVTGTRQIGMTEATSLSPIDVVTPAELAATGATNLNTALSILLPSFNFPQSTITDATDASEPAQLRGLSPNETLVLIDGKRVHDTSIVNVDGEYGRGSSPVDLGAIPMNAIDHIEVLRDGAAAQYGSGAIAGVINIILKKGPKGGSAFLTGGQYVRGDGRTVTGGVDEGMALGKKGWVRVSFDGTRQGGTNRANPDFRFPGDPMYGKTTVHYGLPDVHSLQAAINMQYDFSPEVHLYGFTIVNHRDVWSGGFFRTLTQYQNTQPAAVAVYPRGFLPIEASTLFDDQEVLGVRGTVFGWHYDVSADTGGNSWKLNTADTFNYSLGSASPTNFYIGMNKIRQSVANADFKRVFNPSWVENGLLVAWGLDYEYDQFQVFQGDPQSYAGGGAQVFPGYTPQDAGSHSRNSRAIYLDLESNWTKSLSTEFAVRRSQYSDFGGATTYDLSGRYAFNHVIALRGTAASGFLAPTLQQEYYSNTSTLFINNVPYNIRQFPVSNPAAKALGAQPLRPEQSHSFSAGLVLTPGNDLYVTLDAYQITIAHRIVLSGDLTGPSVSSYLTSVGIPFVDGGAFFYNGVDTRTDGADFVAHYTLPLSRSQLLFTAEMNYNKTEITGIAPNPPQDALHGLVLPIVGPQEAGFLTVSAPRTKAILMADWDVGHWTVQGQLTRYGQWSSISNNGPKYNQTFGARYILDASLSYHRSRWMLTVGGNDVGNTYPQQNNSLNNFFGIFPYPFSSPFGFSGAYYYGTVAYHWY
jgi:iron complex outermembrane receptor protein